MVLQRQETAVEVQDTEIRTGMVATPGHPGFGVGPFGIVTGLSVEKQVDQGTAATVVGIVFLAYKDGFLLQTRQNEVADSGIRRPNGPGEADVDAKIARRRDVELPYLNAFELGRSHSGQVRLGTGGDTNLGVAQCVERQARCGGIRDVDEEGGDGDGVVFEHDTRGSDARHGEIGAALLARRRRTRSAGRMTRDVTVSFCRNDPFLGNELRMAEAATEKSQ